MHHYWWGWGDRRWFLREGRGAGGWMVLKGERWDGEICDFIGGWWWFGGGQHFWVVYTQGAIERGVFLVDWVLHNCSFVSCSQSSNQSIMRRWMSERRACWLSLRFSERGRHEVSRRQQFWCRIVYWAATWSRARSKIWCLAERLSSHVHTYT